MAPNRQFEAEEHVSSSEEDEESSEGNEEQVESESDDGEEEEEEDRPFVSAPSKDKKPSASKKAMDITLQSPAASLDESESDSGSESDSESGDLILRPRKPDPNVKPIASKPMEEPPKATTKARSKSSAPAAATPVKSGTASKRAMESQNNGKDSKKARKKASDAENGVTEDMTAKKASEDPKKQLFQRLWSEEDEIAVLKGVIEYATEYGADPLTDMNAYHEFMKNKLQINVTRTQLYDKVRRLKKKYENNASKEEKGKDQTFLKDHDQKAYDLSKKIWGAEAATVGLDSPKSKGKTKRKQNQKAVKASETPKVEALPSQDIQEDKKMEVEQNVAAPASAPAPARFSKSIGGPNLEEEIIRDGIELIKGAKRSELEEKWKQLRVEEVELYLKKVELIRDQTKLVLEALKSPEQ